ncbi:hypothetical protein SAMN02745136_00981 [Anaerocolumna jejuensis DSM 15929]|uniref:Uncharacterized protein n=1 Tax=Anaerocolumna jejuensis DSM 15929 TaxID=1121322 RepID=A0A1M6MF54_9FIRM|nr:hypothetical protein [Anaerocolumna jejuensis]SHJ82057.1 hypothetical protein SAMN02745136_00981 [Anaerocolumna jejuensis DSM 15929]
MIHASQLEKVCPIGAYPPSYLSETTNEIGQNYTFPELQQIVYQYGALLSQIPADLLIPLPPSVPQLNSEKENTQLYNCLLNSWSVINLTAMPPAPPGPYPFYFFLTGASTFGFMGFLWINQLPSPFPVYVFIPLSNISGISCVF